MKRPEDRRPSQKRRGPLIALDTDAIRNAAFRQIQKQRKALEKETRTLDQFMHAEQPSFLSWLASVAGDLLTQYREVESELQRLEGLVGEVYQRSLTHMMSAEEAYQDLQAEEARARTREGGPPDPEDEEEVDPQMQAEFQAQMKEAFREFLHAAVPPHLRGSFEEEVKRFGKEEFGEDFSWLLSGGGPTHGAGGTDTQLKTLYRQLVGILHPDRRDPKLNQALADELWHALQHAYQDRDLERLQTVYARVEYSLGIETPRQTTVWELRAEVENLRAALRAVKSHVRQARQHPGWKFSSRADLDSYAIRLKRELKQDIDFQQKRVSELAALVESWKAGRLPRRSRRERKQAWPQTPDLF